MNDRFKNLLRPYYLYDSQCSVNNLWAVALCHSGRTAASDDIPLNLLLDSELEVQALGDHPVNVR
jgi:hypothetical protein